MDQFYLDNATLYQTLLKKVNLAASHKTSNVDTGDQNPDVVVSARIRPLLEDDNAAGFPCAVFPRPDHRGVIDIHDLYNHPKGRPIIKSFKYQVDSLFDSQTTTEEIYDKRVAGLIPVAWNGGIGTLFAYGQTGSGKTFTVSRLEQLVAEALTAETLKGDRQVYFTMVELAGNSAYDLLNSRKPVSILEDSSGVTQLVGAEEHRVQGRAEVTDLIERASSHRRTAPTLKNGASSRSHGICRVRIRDPAAGTEGLLYLVDLAGSEAARDVAAHGADRMRETRDINMSLSVLKDCIRGKAMADALKRESRDGPRARQEKPHVPYRRSALTKVLKHVFDPVGSQVCKTVVIACVNPSLGDVGPSKNTLRYAEMLRVVLPKVEDNSGVAPVFQTVVDKATNSMARTSSRDLGQHDIDVPFRKRIRPGMIIRWNPTLGSRSSVGLAEDAVKLAAVLSPANTTSVIMGISPGNRLCGSEHVGATSGDCQAAYLCALLTPSQVENAYELNLWRQTVVGVNEMEQEVILEYDTRTRYYYIST